MSEGFIYYSVGEESVKEAIRSVLSLKKCMPLSNIIVFTNNPEKFQDFGVQTMLVPGDYDKSLRIRLLLSSPYDKTFYIDSDTIFTAACNEIFDLLDENQLCMALTNLKDTINTNIPELFPFYNSGIIGYRLTKMVKKVFNAWEDEMTKALSRNTVAKDEPLLRKVLYRYMVDAVYDLPAKYNYRDNSRTHFAIDTAKIIHGDEALLSSALQST